MTTARAEEAEAGHRDPAEDAGQGPHLATPTLAAPTSQPLPAHGTHRGHAHILGAGPVSVLGHLRPLVHEAPAVEELGVGGQGGGVEVREAGIQQAPPDLAVGHSLDLSLPPGVEDSLLLTHLCPRV